MMGTGNESIVGRVQYPSRGKGPKDVGETFDLVIRNGPISLKGLMDQTHSYSEDEVYGHLEWLVTHEFVTRREGDLEQDGTSRDVYEVNEKRIKDD